MGRHVFIIGLGLIGGSLALAIKDEHQDAVLTGYDTNPEHMNLARLLGIVDRTADSIKDGAVSADLIVVAAPVESTARILRELAQMELKETVIVTDAASTKGTVAEAGEELIRKGKAFIGGHPMSGSHKSGAGAAKRHLFENAFYLLVPPQGLPMDKVAVLKDWLKGTKANFLTVDAGTHDLLTGVVSHFPHIVAAGLVKQADQYSQTYPLISRLAAGGFRDTTRIASSSPDMWRDILLTNKQVLLGLLDDWQIEMEQVRTLIDKEDSAGIYRFFEEAKQFRDKLPVSGKGAIPAFYDLYIDIPDYPGVISEITGYLAQESISLTNIRILETREEIYGVLIISFQTDEDRKRAAACIAANTAYETIPV